VATNGNDSNAGTEASPWRTLTKAANTARAGDTVYIRAGTYTETLRPANSGTAGNLITFKAYPGEGCQGARGQPKVAGSCKVVIDGQNIRAFGVELSKPVNYVRVDGLEVENHIDNGIINFVDWYATAYQTYGNQFLNNYVHDNVGNGIDTENSSDALIENNEIFRNGMTAVRMGGQMGSARLTARGNNIHYNGKDGFQGSVLDSLFEYNGMYDQLHTDGHQDGFDMGNVNGMVIRYNTISDFTQLIYFHEQSGPVSNVEIYGNVLYTYRYYTVGGSGGPGGEAPGIFFATFDGQTLRNVKIHSNTFGWTGYSGIRIYGSSAYGIVVRDNIFYDSGIDIEANSAAEINSDYNIFHNSPRPSYEGPNSLTANPQFVNYVRHVSWDFHLPATSPAINRGDPNLSTVFSLPTDFQDIDNVRRPNGTRFDIGAFEYKP
jgi:hypothetical protein